MRIKHLPFFIFLLAFIPSCQSPRVNHETETNWLIGKWKIDYERTANSYLGKQSIATVKKIIGDNLIEWTADKYIGPNINSSYKITEISPSSLTFEYNIGRFEAKETWQREGELIYFEKPGRYLFYLKPCD